MSIHARSLHRLAVARRDTDKLSELVLASGMEHHVAALRRSDPDALFEQLSSMVRAGYAQRMESDSGEG